MSSLPTQTPTPLAPPLAPTGVEHPAVTARRAARTDQVIAAGRKATPEAAVDQRARPRLSIAELNSMDAAELHEKYLDTGPEDARTSFQKVMDIIDLGRNTNANIAYGHATAAGVVGAYPRAAGVGATFGAVIGGLIGGVGGAIAGLPTGPGAIATGLAGAGAGAAEGAIIGGAGGLVTTGVTQAVHGAIGLGVSKEDRDAITAGKEAGALGQPRIFTSDALHRLGVNNRIINAVVGFGGDLVSDPDTWVGGSGWGAHVGEVAMGPTARRTIQTSIKEAAAGGVEAISDEATRNLVREGIKRTPGMATDAESVATFLRGDVNKGVFPRVVRTLGEGESSTGGVFEKYVNKPLTESNVEDHGLINATNDWITAHVANRPGLKFGTGEQQIAHLPFGGLGPIPEWNISIPGITPASKRTADLFRRAADKTVYVDHPAVADVTQGVGGIEKSIDDMKSYVDDFAGRSQSVMDAADAAPGGPKYVRPATSPLDDLKAEHAATMASANADMDAREAALRGESAPPATLSRDELLTQHRQMRDEYTQRLQTFTDDINTQAQQVRDRFNAYVNDPAALAEMKAGPNTIMALGQLDKRAQAAAAAAREHLNVIKQDVHGYGQVMSAAKRHVETVQETYNRLIAEQASVSRGGATKSVMQTEHPLAASLMPDAEFVPPPEIDTPIGRRQFHQKVEEHLNALATMAPDDPTWADHEFELNLLRSRPTIQDVLSGRIGGGGAERWKKNEYVPIDHATGKPKLNADPVVQAKVFQAIRPTLDALEEATERLVTTQSGGKGSGDNITTGARPLFVPEELSGPVEQAGSAELTARVAALRQQLLEQTAPLRDGPHIGLDDWTESLIKHVEDQYDHTYLNLQHMHEHAPGAAEALVDALRKHADAINNYRSTIGAPLASIMGRDQGAWAGMVRRAWGFADDQQALSSLGQLGAATAPMGQPPGAFYKAVNAIDRQLRPRFGSRHGLNAAFMARLRSRQSGATGLADAIAEEHLGAPLRRAIGELGIPVTQVENAQILLTMKLQQIANDRGISAGTGPVYATKFVQDGKLADSMLAPRMNALMNEIRTAESVDPGAAEKFFAALDAMAGRTLTRINAIGDSEVKDHILGSMLEAYIPHVPGPTTRKVIRAVKGTSGYEARIPFEAEPGQAFQKRRLTTYYKFPDTRPEAAPESWESFMDTDRALVDKAQFSEAAMEELAKTNPEFHKTLTDIQGVIDRYDRLPNKPAGETLDLATLNEAVRAGRFRMLSGDSGMPYFEERLPLLYAARIAQHERAEIAQDLLAMASKSAIGMNAKRFSEMAGLAVKNGGMHATTMPNGEPVTFRQVKSPFDKSTMTVADVRGVTARQLNPAMFKYKDNPVISGWTEGMRDMVLPEPVADFIEDMARVYKDDQISPLLEHLDRATSALKTTQLLGPSWFLKSIVGHCTFFTQAGVNMASWVKKIPEAGRLIWAQGDPEKLAKLKGVLGHQAYSPEAILEANRTGNVIGKDANVFSDAARIQAGVERDSTLPSMLKKMPWYEGTRANFAYRMGQAAAAANPALRKAAYPMAVLGALKDTYNQGIVHPFFNGYQRVNDTVRLAAVMALVEDGSDMRSAIEKIRTAAYDYENMTSFEHKYMRVVVPYYRWARNNLAYQVRMLFEEPKWANAYPKLKNAFEELTAGEQKVPDNMRPEWMLDEMATQLGDNPDSRYALMLGRLAPQVEAAQPIQALAGTRGVMDTARFGLGQLNPLATFLPQLGAGQDFFSGRKIGASEGEGDITAGDFAASQVRPLSEYGPGGRVAEAFRRGGIAGGAARLALGGSAQEFDRARLETTKAREIRDTVENIRRAITMQERRGDHAGSLQSRARLLRVYKKAMDLGLEKQVSVPRWAKTAVAENSGATMR